MTLSTAAYGVGGTATAGGEVNIANGANGRRITGLAAGANATDAVNVSQLNKMGQDTATALGGGAALNATTGIWTAPSYSTNSINAVGTSTGPLVSTNVGAALTNLNTSLTNTAAVAVKYDDPTTKTQVTFNPAGTSVKLTNVAAGALNGTSTDAVNGSQLFATNQTVNNISNGAGIKYFHTNSTLADSAATGTDSVAMGPLAVSGGTNSVAIGKSATTSSASSVAIGDSALAQGGKAVSIGAGNTATGNGAVAIGDPNVATGTGAVAMGADNTANGQGAVALGNTSTATGQGSVALGNASNAAAAGAVALGDTAVANNTNDVALGSKSTTAAPHTGTTAQFGATAAGVQAAASSNGVVSVGAAGTERQIQNVAAGVISATSTDAINGSQLNSVVTGVNNQGTTTASTLGGGAAYSPATGNITGFSQPINSISATGAVAGPTAQTTVAAALTALNTNVNNTANVAVKYDASGGTKITLGATGGAGAGAPVTITNLAPATLNATSTDAVNGSQLFATNTTVNNIATGAGIKYFHTNSTLADSTATGTDSVAVGPTASATATNAMALGNGATAGTANSVALGSGATTAAATATASGVINGTTYTYAGAAPIGVLSLGSAGNERQLSNVAAGKVTATSTDAVNGSQLFSTNTAVNSLGTTVNNITTGAGIKYFHTNSTLADGTATGTDSVAVGPTASATATNAVALGNGATAGSANSVALGSGSSATGTTLGTAAYGVGGTATTGGEVNVANGANGRRITGLAAGALATDAVNVSQLNKAGQDTATALGGGAALDPTTGTWTAPSYSTNSINTSGTNTGALTSNNVGAALGNLNTGLTNTAAVAVKYDNAATKTQITFNPSGAATTLTNVAPGALNATSSDAVNGSQLFATNTTVNNINNGAGIKYFHANSTLADSSATGTDSVAVGPTASSTATNAVALGNGATASTANSVALGSGSSATGTTLGTAAYGVGGTATTGGEVNVANGANGRRITGLAAGASATDAVNVSQLNNASQDTAAALGGGAAVNATTGTWTAPSYSTNSINATGANTGPLLSNNVGAALTNLNTSLTNTAAVAVKYDDAATKTQVTFNPAGTAVKLANVAAGALNATSTDAVNGSQLFATNQTVDNLVNNGTGIKYFHSNSILADSSATGQDSVAIGPLASATLANGVALGANSSATGTTLANAAYGVGGAATAGGEVNIANGTNGRRITGVAAGSSATDAVNVSQLNKAGQDTATALGGGATLDATTGVWTAPSYSTNSISATGANTGPLVSNNVGAALTNLNTSLTNTAAVAVKYDDATTKTQVTFNPAGTAVKLTNVAAGTLNATSTDAVNGSQLFATNQTVDNLVNNGTGIKYFHSNSTLADSSATGQDSVAMGPAAVSTGVNSVALGNGATASIANSIALGSGSSATGATLANAAYGVGGAATGGEVNIANGADSRRITGLAAGSSATDAVNVSQLNSAGQDTATALGGGATLDATTGVWTAPSYSTNSISATGANTGPLVSNNVGAALTNLNTSVTNTAAVAVKYDDATTKTQVTFNPAGTAVKLTNVAAGTLNATSTDAVNGSQLFATNQTVDNLVNNGTGIKYFHSNSTLADSQASGLDSIAIGPQSIAAGANSFAVGSGAQATADGSLALGRLSQAQVAGGIALGEGSVADRVLAPTTGSIAAGSGTIIYDTSDATLLGSVSVGKAGSYRQITNVADATDAHDAVTLRQLTGAMGSLSSTGTLYFHANSTNPTDSLASGSESIAVGPGTVVNGDNGIGLGNQASVSQAATGGIAIGRNSQVLLASGIALGSAAQAAAEQSVALGAGANASYAMSVALGSSSLTTVGAETDYSAYRLAAPQTSVGEIGIGTALGSRKLTGLAAGTQDTDAVNVAQLKVLGTQVDQNTSDITNLDGRVGGLETLIGAGGGIKYLHVNSVRADSAATGTDAMALGPQAQASGNGSVAMGSGATATANGSVAIGSDASDAGRGAETYSGKYSGANNVTSGTVSVGNATTGATRTISNVADGNNATDAVNVRQLDGAVAEAKQYTDDSIANLGAEAGQQGARITAVEGDVTNLKNGTDGMFQVNNSSAATKPKATGTDAIAGGAGAQASGNNSAAVGTRSQASGENSVALGNGAEASARNATALGANSVADRDNSVSVGSAGNERQLTNLAAGTHGTDAVNLDQLDRSVADITTNANAYTDQRYMELKKDLKDQDETLSAGIAGAMAMSSLPQSYVPGGSMTTAATAIYRGQSSLAVGVSHMSANGRWVTKLQGSTDSQRNVGLAVGVGYQW
ncbi:YadA-like family protein [Pseudomonas sp. D2002]|uniref:YadA-like family protein n=1 Tax=Pseudomonas sp. D2002 TaxID=2726980 RepID=UPI0027379F97|nr:YadA-like family protein [Pseudomonas sp. D2002]